MKSPAKKTRDAGELLAVAGVTNAELVACTVRSFETCVHLTPRAFVRVVALFGVARSKVNFDVGESQSLFADFRARGARWTCCVLADSPEMRALRKALDAKTAPRLQGPGRAALPPPSPKLLFNET